MPESPDHGPEEIAETVSCTFCDASCDSLAEAEAEGWKDVEQDLQGFELELPWALPELPGRAESRGRKAPETAD
jgi:hypothetical protein